jgi:hypothetical protein
MLFSDIKLLSYLKLMITSNKLIHKTTSRTRTSENTNKEILKRVNSVLNKEKKMEFFLNSINMLFSDNITLLSLTNLFDSLKRNKANLTHILEWVHEYDADDFLDLFRDKTLINKINYKISNFFFRNSLNIHAQLPSLLTELATMIKDERYSIDEFKRILLICFDTLIKLITSYPKLISLDKYFKITEQPPPENIFLYRGFVEGQNAEILEDVNRQISSSPLVTIHAVLSTSIKLSVAYNFSSKEGGTIWRIIVNKSKYEKFKYSYVSSYIVINSETIKNGSPENEFLLNYGIKLIHVETKEINDDGKIFTLQTFAFADYDVYQLDSDYIRFLQINRDYINSIDFPTE